MQRNSITLAAKRRKRCQSGFHARHCAGPGANVKALSHAAEIGLDFDNIGICLLVAWQIHKKIQNVGGAIAVPRCHEAAAAGAGKNRFCQAGGNQCGEDGLERIATLIEHSCCRIGGDAMAGGDSACLQVSRLVKG